MIEFDNALLEARLTGLSPVARLAFAVAAAARQLPSYECFATLFGLSDPLWPRSVLEQLYEKLQLNKLEARAWTAILEEVMERIPAESPDVEGVLDLMAQQAMSALAYAVRCLLSGDSQEAAWAALCEYEAVDQAAIKALKIDFGMPGAEAAILSHSFVQRALRRQREDIQSLERGEVDEVIRRSVEMATFTPAELASFG